MSRVGGGWRGFFGLTHAFSAVPLLVSMTLNNHNLELNGGTLSSCINSLDLKPDLGVFAQSIHRPPLSTCMRMVFFSRNLGSEGYSSFAWNFISGQSFCSELLHKLVGTVISNFF